MVKAKKLVGNFEKNLNSISSEETFVYNILMEEHERMKVNNLIVKTLLPNHSQAVQFKEKNIFR